MKIRFDGDVHVELNLHCHIMTHMRIECVSRTHIAGIHASMECAMLKMNGSVSTRLVSKSTSLFVVACCTAHGDAVLGPPC